MTPDPLTPPAPVTTWAQPPALPPHPKARTALVLGLIGVIGFFCCLLPALVSPFAWYYGAVVRREVEREPARWGGRQDGTVGMILGIVGTALLALAFVVTALVVGGMALLLTFESGYQN